MKKFEENVLSIDFETNGLWGTAFSAGAVLYKITETTTSKIDSFVGRCPIEGAVNNFVAQNVLPEMEKIPENFKSYTALLTAFADFYLKNKSNATIIVHMGLPVEARVFLDMHSKELIGDWDAPYPLIDIAGNLQQAGFDPTSVDAYIASHGIEIPKFDGGTHNPLYDAEAAFWCYYNLKYSSDRS